MRARRTPWYYFTIAAILGVFAGALLAYLTKNSTVNLLGSSWLVPIVLVGLGIFVLVLARDVRKFAKGDIKDLNPRRSFNTLVLAKSLEIAGSALTGWYVGQLIIVIPHGDSPYYSEVILECAVSAAAAVFDVIAGIIAEWWCQLPPNEGADNPKAKQRKKMLDAASPKASQPSKVTPHATRERNHHDTRESDEH